jgi:hypothetical protein
MKLNFIVPSNSESLLFLLLHILSINMYAFDISKLCVDGKYLNDLLPGKRVVGIHQGDLTIGRNTVIFHIDSRNGDEGILKTKYTFLTWLPIDKLLVLRQCRCCTE